MTDEELDAIENRAAEATPGPWDREWYDGPIGIVSEAEGVADEDALIACIHMDCVSSRNVWINGEFIAHAREDVPALIAELRAARVGGTP